MQSLGAKFNPSVARDLSSLGIAFLGGQILGGLMKSKIAKNSSFQKCKEIINSETDLWSTPIKQSLYFTTVNIITHLTMNPFIILGGNIALGFMAELLHDKKEQEEKAKQKEAEAAKQNQEMIARLEGKIDALTNVINSNSTHPKNDQT